MTRIFATGSGGTVCSSPHRCRLDVTDVDIASQSRCSEE